MNLSVEMAGLAVERMFRLAYPDADVRCGESVTKCVSTGLDMCKIDIGIIKKVKVVVYEFYFDGVRYFNLEIYAKREFSTTFWFDGDVVNVAGNPRLFDLGLECCDAILAAHSESSNKKLGFQFEGAVVTREQLLAIRAALI